MNEVIDISLLNKEEKLVYDAFIAVRKEYRDLNDGKIGSNKWITKRLKEEIGKIGETLGYKIKSSEHNSEWLYDLVWYTANEEGLLEEVVLALESEMSDRNASGLLVDFDKLFVSNSRCRIMLSMGKSGKHPENVLKQIDLYSSSFKANTALKPGERILALIWDDYNTDNIYSHLMIKS